MEGLHGVFATLAKQHAEVSALMARVESDTDKRTELWPVIRAALVSHEKAELRVVYPELRLNPATRGLADQHEDDAKELESMIDDLDATTLDANMWMGKFKILSSMVRDHAKLEEKDIFPHAQDVIGKIRTKALDDEFLAAKKQIEQAVH